MELEPKTTPKNRAENNSNELSAAEQERIDRLLSSVRTYHYACFILAGLSLAISSLEHMDPVKLPLAGLTLPSIQAAVAVYVITIALAFLCEGLFSMAYPWIKLDRRRPPFPWIALGRNVSLVRVTIWIIFPVFLCGLSTSLSIRGDYVGMGLLYGGVFAVVLRRTISYYHELITEKADARGGPATFSIYLLYWFRMIQRLLITSACILAVLAAVPKWRPVLLQVIGAISVMFILVYVMRLIAGIPPVYRRIDRFGKRFSFPPESKHYR